MADVRYYIGETLSITLDATDDTGAALDITGYEFLLCLYTDKHEPIIYSTTQSEGHPNYLLINRPTDSQLELAVPSSYTAKLRPGVARLEIKARDTEDNWRSIASLAFIEFLPSTIATIDES